jgi:hypothetical protein
VVLKPIVNIGKYYFETTLLDCLELNHTCNYQTLPKATTVRIAIYSHHTCLYVSKNTLKISPAVKIEDKDHGLAEWTDFRYSEKGNLPKCFQHQHAVAQADLSTSIQSALGHLKPIVARSNIARENKDAAIQQWAQNVELVQPSGSTFSGGGPSGTASNNSSSSKDSVTF